MVVFLGGDRAVEAALEATATGGVSASMVRPDRWGAGPPLKCDGDGTTPARGEGRGSSSVQPRGVELNLSSYAGRDYCSALPVQLAYSRRNKHAARSRTGVRTATLRRGRGRWAVGQADDCSYAGSVSNGADETAGGPDISWGQVDGSDGGLGRGGQARGSGSGGTDSGGADSGGKGGRVLRSGQDRHRLVKCTGVQQTLLPGWADQPAGRVADGLRATDVLPVRQRRRAGRADAGASHVALPGVGRRAGAVDRRGDVARHRRSARVRGGGRADRGASGAGARRGGGVGVR